MATAHKEKEEGKKDIRNSLKHETGTSLFLCFFLLFLFLFYTFVLCFSLWLSFPPLLTSHCLLCSVTKATFLYVISFLVFITPLALHIHFIFLPTFVSYSFFKSPFSFIHNNFLTILSCLSIYHVIASYKNNRHTSVPLSSITKSPVFNKCNCLHYSS